MSPVRHATLHSVSTVLNPNLTCPNCAKLVQGYGDELHVYIGIAEVEHPTDIRNHLLYRLRKCGCRVHALWIEKFAEEVAHRSGRSSLPRAVVRKHALHDSHKEYLNNRIKELLAAGTEFVGAAAELTATIHELMALCPGDHNVIGDVPDDILASAARKARSFGIPTPDLPKHRVNSPGAIAMSRQVQAGKVVTDANGEVIGLVADTLPTMPGMSVQRIPVGPHEERHVMMPTRQGPPVPPSVTSQSEFHNTQLGSPYDAAGQNMDQMRPVRPQPVSGQGRAPTTQRNVETEITGDERYRQQLMDACAAGLVSADTVMREFGFDVTDSEREGNEVRSREVARMSQAPQVPGEFVARRDPEREPEGLSNPSLATITHRIEGEQRAGRWGQGAITPEAIMTMRQLLLMEDLTARTRLERAPLPPRPEGGVSAIQASLNQALDSAERVNDNGDSFSQSALDRIRRGRQRELGNVGTTSPETLQRIRARAQREEAARDRHRRRQQQASGVQDALMAGMGFPGARLPSPAAEVESPSPWTGNGVRKAGTPQVKPEERERLLNRVTAKRKRRRIIKLEDNDGTQKSSDTGQGPTGQSDVERNEEAHGPF